MNLENKTAIFTLAIPFASGLSGLAFGAGYWPAGLMLLAFLVGAASIALQCADVLNKEDRRVRADLNDRIDRLQSRLSAAEIERDHIKRDFMDANRLLAGTEAQLKIAVTARNSFFEQLFALKRRYVGAIPRDQFHEEQTAAWSRGYSFRESIEPVARVDVPTSWYSGVPKPKKKGRKSSNRKKKGTP